MSPDVTAYLDRVRQGLETLPDDLPPIQTLAAALVKAQVEIERAHGLAGEWIDARQHRQVKTQLDHWRKRAERAESALATERAVSTTLVRQIQAVRALAPASAARVYENVHVPRTYVIEYLDRAEVLKLLSPQNDQAQET